MNRHTLPPQVARDFRAARLASQWSLTSLATEVGISRGHLTRIQNDNRPRPMVTPVPTDFRVRHDKREAMNE